MDPIEFEHLVLETYRRLGWKAEPTRASGDQGVDGFLRRDGKTFVLQCKKFAKTRVGSPVLRDLLGTIVKEKASGGILVTTSSFTEEAIAWAGEAANLTLVDGDSLVKMIHEAFPADSPVPEEFVTKRRHPSIVPSRCPWCGARIRRRKGKYGAFFGCTKFPSCKWSMPAPRRPNRAERRSGW